MWAGKTPMIHLPQVTLISVNCTDPMAAARALRYSMRGIIFGGVVLYTHDQIPNHPEVEVRIIPKLSYNEYNDFILAIICGVDTDYALVIQDDGFVTTPEMWDPRFLEYDYIGAPWPTEPSWVDQQRLAVEIRGVFPNNRVGNGGFSLRSRKFMEASAEFDTCGGLGEDAFLCTKNYHHMVNKGIKFAPMDLAYKFSYENPLLEYGHHWNASVDLKTEEHFGFHGRQFRNSEDVIRLKNTI